MKHSKCCGEEKQNAVVFAHCVIKLGEKVINPSHQRHCLDVLCMLRLEKDKSNDDQGGSCRCVPTCDFSTMFDLTNQTAACHTIQLKCSYTFVLFHACLTKKTLWIKHNLTDVTLAVF